MAELMERKRLITYLPRFMQNFSEMKEMLNAANVETDTINNQVGRILDEAFLNDCTEYGLQKYEKLTGLIPSDSETLEVRKSKVMMYWFNQSPYTLRVLRRKLDGFCGEGNYEIVEDMEQYKIIVKTRFTTQEQIEWLKGFLELFLPMNVCLEIENDIILSAKENLFAAATATTAVVYIAGK